MLNPYKRDLMARSFFRFAEILFGASFVSIWFAPIPTLGKFAVGGGIVLILVLAIVLAPHKNPAAKES